MCRASLVCPEQPVLSIPTASIDLSAHVCVVLNVFGLRCAPELAGCWPFQACMCDVEHASMAESMPAQAYSSSALLAVPFGISVAAIGFMLRV